MTVDELSRIANRLRLDVVETVHDAGDGHPGPCMSIADIMAVLFFDEMKLDPANPHWPERDRFVLSKGHACPILYAALARKGYFPLEELKGLRSLNSFLQGHPDMNKIPGVDTVSGSLGNGVAIGLGMATGCRMQGIENYVYVIVGDGEEQEGIIWEAAMAAANNDEKNIAALKELQKRWSEIGLVPISKKDMLYDRFRHAIDAQFAKINIDENKRNEIRIKHLIESAEANPQALEKLRNERDRLKSRLDGLRQQIALSENNLGFFAKSKNADAMIESFRRKMEKQKSEADVLQKTINTIGNAINEVLSKKGDTYFDVPCGR